MWDYDKLFAKGNIIGVKNCYENFIYNQIIGSSENNFWVNGYQNNELSYKKQHVINDKDGSEYTTDFEIQYIIRLDEHGNVVERLFDRARDMSNSMPELETGMFIRIADKTNWRDNTVAYVDYQNNRIIAKEGWYEKLSNRDEWQYLKIVEVFSKSVCCFDQCVNSRAIWRSLDYQTYLDSKN